MSNPLTPARVREALLLLQAVEAVGQCAENEGRCASLDVGMPSTKTGEVVIHAYGHEVVSGFSQAPTLTEALTGLLDALGQEERWTLDDVRAALEREMEAALRDMISLAEMASETSDWADPRSSSKRIGAARAALDGEVSDG